MSDFFGLESLGMATKQSANVDLLLANQALEATSAALIANDCGHYFDKATSMRAAIRRAGGITSSIEAMTPEIPANRIMASVEAAEKGWFARAWDAIKAFCARVWNWIVTFFKSNKTLETYLEEMIADKGKAKFPFEARIVSKSVLANLSNFYKSLQQIGTKDYDAMRTEVNTADMTKISSASDLATTATAYKVTLAQTGTVKKAYEDLKQKGQSQDEGVVKATVSFIPAVAAAMSMSNHIRTQIGALYREYTQACKRVKK